MSTVNSDPLFVRAEVAYRLERYGVGGARTGAPTSPAPGTTWRRWAVRHLPALGSRHPRGLSVAGRARHP